MTQQRRLANREGQAKYDIKWRWASHLAGGGFTAVVWVRDDAHACLPFSLPPLLRSVERVIVIDNGSINRWEMAETIAADTGTESSLRVMRTTPSNSLFPVIRIRDTARFGTQPCVRPQLGAVPGRDTVCARVGGRCRAHRGGGGGPWRIVLEIGVPRFDRGVPCSMLVVQSDGEGVFRKGLGDVMAAWPNEKGVSIGKGKDRSIVHAPPRLPNLRMPDFLCFRVVWADSGKQGENGSPTSGASGTGQMLITASNGEHVIEAAQRAPRSRWSRTRVG